MLRIETVKPDTFALLENLSKNESLKNFRLVGGTALSLQIGHRISIDLDFFTDTDFNVHQIIEILNQYGELEIINQGKNLIQGSLNDIKIDFATHKYEWLDSGEAFNNLHIASIEDISAMKLAAILSRGKKRDFIDVAAILQATPLKKMLSYFKKKYHQDSVMHVIRGLGYFEDAEKDKSELKILNTQLTWKKSKMIIGSAIRELGKNRDSSF